MNSQLLVDFANTRWDIGSYMKPLAAETITSTEATPHAHPEQDATLEADAMAQVALIKSIIGPLVPVLAEALRPHTEVVLHDLSRLPNSIIAIGGSITGRQIGGPATDLGLRMFRSGWSDDLLRYRTEGPDGTVMRSSSLFFRDPQGRAIACLCINTDIGSLVRVEELLKDLTQTNQIQALSTQSDEPISENFTQSVEELADNILRETISSCGVPVELMKKSHKISVVRELNSRGFFLIKESVDLAAHALDVSRFTIYNYLNEIDG